MKNILLLATLLILLGCSKKKDANPTPAPATNKADVVTITCDCLSCASGTTMVLSLTGVIIMPDNGVYSQSTLKFYNISYGNVHYKSTHYHTIEGDLTVDASHKDFNIYVPN